MSNLEPFWPKLTIFKRDPNFLAGQIPVNFQTWRRPTFWGLQSLVKVCSQISEISNVGYCLQALAIHSINSIQSVQVIRPDSIQFISVQNWLQSIFSFSIKSARTTRSVRFNPLNPIQSNRPDSIRFGPIRSDSVRFRIRYNAFGPIQIFWIRQIKSSH